MRLAPFRWLRRDRGKWHALDEGRVQSLCLHFLDHPDAPHERFQGEGKPDGLLCIRCAMALKNRENYARAVRG